MNEMTYIQIEAKDLEAAYLIAASKLDCSAADIHIEIIQQPRAGFLGLFSKNGVFKANRQVKSFKNDKIKKVKRPIKKNYTNTLETNSKPQTQENKIIQENKQEEIKEENKIHIVEKQKTKNNPLDAYNNIVDGFNKSEKQTKETLINADIIYDIKIKLDELFATKCFDISVMEVSKYDDKTVYIRLDGDDCALLIGKEGYRYKALSYLIYNWINAKYNLNIRLEIAEFLKNQEQSISNYLNDVIAKIESNGKGHTKPLDGVLVKIALEQLRARFPQKYVGIKQSNDGKYVAVGDFHKK